MSAVGLRFLKRLREILWNEVGVEGEKITVEKRMSFRDAPLGDPGSYVKSSASIPQGLINFLLPRGVPPLVFTTAQHISRSVYLQSGRCRSLWWNPSFPQDVK